MRVVGAVNHSGHRLTVSDIFRHPSLRDMATTSEVLGNGVESQTPENPAEFSLLPVAQTVGEILRRADINVQEDEVEDMVRFSSTQTSRKSEVVLGRS
jgi:hypothetical protein